MQPSFYTFVIFPPMYVGPTGGRFATQAPGIEIPTSNTFSIWSLTFLGGNCQNSWSQRRLQLSTLFSRSIKLMVNAVSLIIGTSSQRKSVSILIRGSRKEIARGNANKKLLRSQGFSGCWSDWEAHSFASVLRGNKPTSPENDGWDFIQGHGELDKSDLKQLKRIHHHVINLEGCPIHGWKVVWCKRPWIPVSP